MAKGNKNKDAAAKVAAASTPETKTAQALAPNEVQGNAAAKGDGAEYDYVVLTAFRDKNDVEKKVKEPRMYAVGSTVNQFGAERLEDLVNRKLVERRAKA